MVFIFSQIFGRRPLSGTKTYMKPRKLLNEQGKPLTYKEIYEKYGLEPIDRNPVRIVLANIHDIDRFLMKEDIVDQFKKNGLTEFVRERTKPPSTYAKVNDYVFTKYAQPEYTEKEAYDRNKKVCRPNVNLGPRNRAYSRQAVWFIRMADGTRPARPGQATQVQGTVERKQG